MARAADRIRQETNEVLPALFEGDALRVRLDDARALLPLPVGLIEDRDVVAGAVLEAGGPPRAAS
jgi:hypothetical protein